MKKLGLTGVLLAGFTMGLSAQGLLPVRFGEATPVSSTAERSATPIASAAAARGNEIFQQSCAVCHGKRGKGDGLAASSLNPRPANLATLARRNGAFPRTRVESVFTGSGPVEAHSPVMMIWRALFLADANGNQAAVDARVKDLLAFLESIQVK
jgi:hypothetical protein